MTIMKVATEKEIIAALLLALILLFCVGILAAFGTMNGWWLILSAIAFFILVKSAKNS